MQVSIVAINTYISKLVQATGLDRSVTEQLQTFMHAPMITDYNKFSDVETAASNMPNDVQAAAANTHVSASSGR